MIHKHTFDGKQFSSQAKLLFFSFTHKKKQVHSEFRWSSQDTSSALWVSWERKKEHPAEEQRSLSSL